MVTVEFLVKALEQFCGCGSRAFYVTSVLWSPFSAYVLLTHLCEKIKDCFYIVHYYD